jgi:hypothetical protein
VSEEHSDLGGSSMDRAAACPGSVSLLRKLEPSEAERDDDTEHSKRGTAAHEVARQCLTDQREPWEFIGQTIEGVAIDIKITEAVQMYVNDCWPIIEGAEVLYIEHRFADPTVHRKFKGTVDLGALKEGTLYVRDFKNGVLGVDITSMQFRYYAYAMLLLHPEARRVNIGVVQPNGFHSDGPVRVEEFPADDLHEWAANTLVPAMLRAERDGTLRAGDHCTFCPLKIMCPMLQGLYRAALTTPVASLSRMSDAQVAEDAKLVDAVKLYIKAVEAELYHRMMNGRELPGFKLVAKKANRMWKPEAEAVIAETYGTDAYKPAEFKSPSQIEAIGPAAKELVKKWAYKPNDPGLTVAPESDPREAKSANTIRETFAEAIDAEMKSYEI